MDVPSTAFVECNVATTHYHSETQRDQQIKRKPEAIKQQPNKRSNGKSITSPWFVLAFLPTVSQTCLQAYAEKMLLGDYIDSVKIYDSWLVVHSAKPQSFSTFANAHKEKDTIISIGTKKCLHKIYEHPCAFTVTKSTKQWCGRSHGFILKDIAQKMFAYTNIQSIIIHNGSLVVSLHVRQAPSILKKTWNLEDVDIAPISKAVLKTIGQSESQYKLEKAVIIVEQKEQLLNHVLIFDSNNRTYYNRPVVAWVLCQMLGRMEASSKKRKHGFNKNLAKLKLLDAFLRMAADFQCDCGRPSCKEIMQIYGNNQISPDRVNNSLGYVESTQVIRFVTQPHNTLIAYNSVSRPSGSGNRRTKWYTVLVGGMRRRTKQRVTQLKKKPVKTDFDKMQIARFESERTVNPNTYLVKLLIPKKETQLDCCFKCSKTLYFGDGNGLFKMSNLPNQVSPDRCDNDNIFYDDNNFNLVCASCNFCENRGGRTYVENKAKNQPIPFTLELLKECKEWLQKE